MKLINKYANSRYSKMNEYYCGITTELDKLAGLDPNGHWKHYVLCDYEDGCLPIRIPGGTLGSIEYDELSLIQISEPTSQSEISYAVFCLKKKKQHNTQSTLPK